MNSFLSSLHPFVSPRVLMNSNIIHEYITNNSNRFQSIRITKISTKVTANPIFTFVPNEI